MPFGNTVSLANLSRMQKQVVVNRTLAGSLCTASNDVCRLSSFQRSIKTACFIAAELACICATLVAAKRMAGLTQGQGLEDERSILYTMLC